ncbi:Putative uncharacterized protein [Moritella viscosa]|uniref:Uncharacterized protein n=1 Tax=Moritella viscosa TaxID=80854 RepID=A0A1K9ZR35_9GAMM|nr:Putative uncharacterized protein [Moritella viscosa]SHO10064.1 Putative uncharacterized protein [Moritella viscosa]SHO14338.1 Putative uncharacterized protein [Moritella viscosa]SHO14381.1 Putative uncharacterized protein [Moritella viscosa]SHO18885.1 Putative uncharacterized protein [Moritella viscosa]
MIGMRDLMGLLLVKVAALFFRNWLMWFALMVYGVVVVCD